MRGCVSVYVACVCACVGVRARVCEHALACRPIPEHICTHMCVSKIYLQFCTHIPARARSHTHTHTHIHNYTHTRSCTHVSASIFKQLRTIDEDTHITCN